jgi:Ala-tRNA(Pro) deacylase
MGEGVAASEFTTQSLMKLNWNNELVAIDYRAENSVAATAGNFTWVETLTVWAEFAVCALRCVSTSCGESAMATAMTVEEFLDRHHLPYEMVSHEPTDNSLDSARAAHIPPERVAKGVLLHANGKFVLAVTRADCHLNLPELRRQLQAEVGLATREEIESVFDDCVLGAVPPLGPAYGIESIWDDELAKEPDLYFELGDHTHLVHLNTRDYLALLANERHGSFSEPASAAHPSLWAAT